MPHLVAAPDKFRGTASAAEVAAAAARGAQAAGWSADEVPLADGGEGTLDVLFCALGALGGERRLATVPGPLGTGVEAEWLYFGAGLGDAATRVGSALTGAGPGLSGPFPPTVPVAVIESALVVGRALLPSPEGDDPVQASTDGVGQLILHAIEAGARLVIVGCGGTATTDGGHGALRAHGALDGAGLGRATGAGGAGGTRDARGTRNAGGAGGTRGATLVVAYDVATRFGLAAETFGPQKGATPLQVTALSARLDELAHRYRDDLGVDVDGIDGAGAGGGLAGGLAAAGARLVPGFELIAALVDLDRRVAAADLVMTGEGRVDTTSFAGKVVGGVLGAANGTPPALCVAGEIEPGVERHWAARPGPVDAVSLVGAVGSDRARRTTTSVVVDLVASACRASRPTATPR